MQLTATPVRIYLNICLLPQGLINAWALRKESRKIVTPAIGNAASRSLRARVKAARREVYCILNCEQQTKRTSLATGQSHPKWNEEIAFKSVQISSDLQVRSVLSQTCLFSWIDGRGLEDLVEMMAILLSSILGSLGSFEVLIQAVI